MPKFTPEKEREIIEAYIRNPNYAAVGRERRADQKAVKNVVERFRKSGIAKSAEEHAKDPLRQNERGTRPARDEIKRMYKLFLDGRRPVKMITEDGFDPVDIQNEHDRFQKLEGRDPHFMQEKLMKRLATLVPAQGKSKDKFEFFRDIFENYHYLTSRQFDELLSMLVRLSHRNGLNSVRNASMPAPDDWRRLTCTNCGGHLSGVVYDPNDLVGIEIEKFGRVWTHEKCPASVR